LAQYDPTYRTRGATDDNSSTLGNGTASELSVPLRGNGSAYFRITGGSDAGFNGGHAQSGRYYVDFNIYEQDGTFYKSLPRQYEDVAPGMVDNVWVDPPAAHDGHLDGATVEVIVNNIVGPGTGDSLDYFLFSGLVPNRPFTATLTVAAFNPLLGLYDNDRNLIATSNPLSLLPTLSGDANSQGKALLGVTGRGDSLFKGEHIETGQYNLVVTQEAIVPEPTSTVLLGLGGTLAGLVEYRRRRRSNRAPKRALDQG
jgi:hypothetical protein